jgi:type IV pilus assembly protein PilQ
VKKRFLILTLLCLVVTNLAAQTVTKAEIKQLNKHLDSLEKHIPALAKKVNFTFNYSEFPTFIKAIATVHKLNISVDPQLKSLIVSQTFTNVSVKEVLVYSAQKYNLEITTFGSIFTIKRKQAQQALPKELKINYSASNKYLTLDLQNDPLGLVFKKITNKTGQNIIYTPNLGSKQLSVFIKEMPLKNALEKLALVHNLSVVKTTDGFYQVTDNVIQTNGKSQRAFKSKNSNFYFSIKDSLQKIIDVDFVDIASSTIINEIGLDLKINMFTSSPLTKMDKVSYKAKNIHFDTLLNHLFEKDTVFSYKKENNIYFFGKRKQNSLRNTVTIPLIHRTIQILDEPISEQNGFNTNPTSSYVQNGFSNASNGRSSNQYSRQQPVSRNMLGTATSKDNTENLLDIIPDEVKKQLEIQSDLERNSFIVSGPSQRIEKFRKFIKLIDKPIPVITIDVMILEVNKSSSVSTGISMGIGDAPTQTSGGVYPNTDLTLGATSINKVINGLNGLKSLNLGKVTPNFYAKIEALETNGDLDIKSTPRLTSLNGHEANFSNGERSYYAVTTSDIIGSQNPQTREIKNYYPVDANLSIKIRPIISGDGQITLGIKVIQSSFNGKKIDEDAPPGINSREFTSTIRVKNEDVIILGGLEENLKNDSGSGVPFLARIPIIKYLFSKRTRTASKKKLTVLIKPTIYK